MAYYRLYILDSDGRITHFKEFDCADDAEATRQVSEQGVSASMELWNLDRLVGRFAPKEN